MSGGGEIDAYSGAGDVLTPFTNVPSSKEGEFSAPGTNPVYPGAEAEANTQKRTPMAAD